MTLARKVKIDQEIYVWTINESQRNYQAIKNRFSKIDAWVSQTDHPTFRQVQDLANFLKVPLGYMFLENPPKTSIIKSEFRTIGNKMPEISKDLLDTLYIIGRRRDWLSEHRRAKGWGKLLTGDFSNLNERNIYLAKKYLELDDLWYKKYRNKDDAFNYLREKLESKGIIVMQSGVVGSNNHRRLNVDEFRGFLLYDDLAPFIFINNRDSKAGKIFTLIHEYIHFLMKTDDIFIKKDSDETYINMITAELLIPTPHILELWDSRMPELTQIEMISQVFHVSELAAALKLKKLDKITQDIVKTVKQRTEKMLWGRGVRKTKGNYYITNRSRLGNSFIKAVIQGAESGDISYTYAFDLLGGSATLYDYFREEFF